jgi:hypothetical protein
MIIPIFTVIKVKKKIIRACQKVEIKLDICSMHVSRKNRMHADLLLLGDQTLDESRFQSNSWRVSSLLLYRDKRLCLFFFFLFKAATLWLVKRMEEPRSIPACCVW